MERDGNYDTWHTCQLRPMYHDGVDTILHPLHAMSPCSDLDCRINARDVCWKVLDTTFSLCDTPQSVGSLPC
jgi:hypothetical protein